MSPRHRARAARAWVAVAAAVYACGVAYAATGGVVDTLGVAASASVHVVASVGVGVVGEGSRDAAAAASSPGRVRPPGHRPANRTTVRIVAGRRHFDLQLTAETVASLQASGHVGVAGDTPQYSAAVTAVLDAVGAVELWSRRAVEELLPAAEGSTPLWRSHLEFIVEDLDAPTPAGRRLVDSDATGALLRHVYLDFTSLDDPHDVADALCARHLPFAVEQCRPYVVGELQKTLAADQAHPWNPLSVVPKAHYTPGLLPTCLLLREGFVPPPVAPPAPDVPILPPGVAAPFGASFRLGLLHYTHSDATGPRLATMLQRAGAMAGTGRYRVHVTVYATVRLALTAASFGCVPPACAMDTHVLDPALQEDFAWAARRHHVAHAVPFTVSAFFESDHDVTVAHVDAFLAWSAVRDLPPNWIVGMLQYETGADGQRHLLNGALLHNDAYRVYTVGRHQYLSVQNVHQAGFMATRQQLLRAVASGCLHATHVPHWSYRHIEAADTELYFRCGFQKVVPLVAVQLPDGRRGVSVQPFLLHHLPDKYVQEGTGTDKWLLTDDMLMQWVFQQCAPVH